MDATAAAAVALTSIRLLSYAMLGWAVFHLGMSFGKWYRAEILEDQLEFKLPGDIMVHSFYTEKFLLFGLPIVLAAALGGVYEAIWNRRELSVKPAGPEDGDESKKESPGVFTVLHGVMHFKFRPMGQYAPWLTVGEATVLFLWVIAMGAMAWQGVVNYDDYFYELYGPCEVDPSSWCSLDTGEIGPNFAQYRLFMAGIFMGLVCSGHFAIILVPVARDSKIWSALGVPFERAVLYHAIAGHLTFASLFTHALIFVVYWVWFDGWGHAVRESIHHDNGGINIPMGWMAGLCALPMWITSINYVRRRWYSLFKLSHWLFIGIFVFSVMHWDANVFYFLGGLALYVMHVMSRLEAWKRWRYWNRWLSPETKASPTSLVNVLTTQDYTRLVLRNPKTESARGGTFVYLSCPAALGTDEAHAITVALRGSPPSSVPEKVCAFPEQDVFTVYVKELGPWTKALRLVSDGPAATASPQSLLVDVDGFYNTAESFTSMLAGGVSRIIVVAGGSGMTSLMGFIQDWCVAAGEGVAVPELHLAWCCRYMAEMELVGEAIPSMLARAGEAKNTHFNMSLYCSKPDSKSGDLSVTWALDNMAYANSTTATHVIGETSIANSLHHSARVIVAGLASYGASLLGFHETHRRRLTGVFHQGAIMLVLVLICIISSLLVYDWLCKFASMCRHRGHQVGTQTAEESKVDLESSSMGGSANYEVQRGRVPTRALLTQESDLALKNGVSRIKVLASGPNSLVDKVMSESRSINWKLFDTEAFSFEF